MASTICTSSDATTIREATHFDINAIVAMGGRFLSSTTYRGRIKDNPTQRAALVMHLIDSDNSVIFVADKGDDELVGFLGLFTYRHPMSDQLFAAEIAWWVEPEARGKTGLQLLSAGETWAKNQKAEVLQMIAPIQELEQLYLRRGYIPIERHFQKAMG